MSEHQPPARGPYQTIVDTIPHLVWVAGPDGRVEYLNQRFLAYAGLSAADVPGWDWTRVVHPDDLRAALTAWNRAVQAGEQLEVEYRLRRADGAYRWHVGQAAPLRDEADRVARWFGTCTDFHDRKQAEEALRASEAKFRAIVERSYDGFSLIAADRTIRYTSPAVTRMLGFRPEELIGTDAWDWAHPDDRPGLSVWLADLLARPGGSVEIWYRFRHRDGSYRRLEIAATNLLADPDLGAIVATFRDITAGRPPRPG